MPLASSSSPGILTLLHRACRLALLAIVAVALHGSLSTASGSLPLALSLAVFATYEAMVALLSGLAKD